MLDAACCGIFAKAQQWMFNSGVIACALGVQVKSERKLSAATSFYFGGQVKEVPQLAD